MIGGRYGRFEVIAALGEGGMGTVWRARDPLLQRDVALKVVRPHRAEDPATRNQLLREARIVSRLAHGGIIPVFDSGFEGDELYVAMQLVEGTTLADHMRGRQLPVQELDRIANPLFLALIHAHDAGVVHRDISTRNVMIDAKGNVYLLDFGLAVSEDRSATLVEGGAVGTIPFMAPEVVAGTRGDERSDQYSLAAVLYEAATGMPPFRGDNAAATLHAITNEALTPPLRRRTDLPLRIEVALVRALEKDPARRFACVDDFAAAWKGENVDASTIRVDPVRRTTGRISRRDWIIATAAIAAAASLGIWWLRRPSASRPRRIAILPPENQSEFPGKTDHWAGTIPFALLHRLIEALRTTEVVAWETSRKYSPTELSPREIGDAMRATHLLAWNFWKSGTSIHIAARLIAVQTEANVWSYEMDLDAGDLDRAHAEIAIGVGAALEGELDSRARETLARTEIRDVRAWELYLKGQQLVGNGTPRAMDLAAASFRRAIEVDPELPEPHIGLGVVLNDLYFRGRAEEPELLEARAHFDRAYALRGDLAPLRGLIHNFWLGRNGRRVFELGLEVRTRADNDLAVPLALGEAWLFCRLGDEAVNAFQRAKRNLPDDPTAYWYLVVAAAWADLPLACVRAADEYERRFGEDGEVLLWKAAALFDLGRPGDSTAAFERSIALAGTDSGLYNHLMLGQAYADLGRHAKARESFETGLSEVDVLLAGFPGNLRNQMTRGIYLYELGRVDELVAHVEWLLTISEMRDHPPMGLGAVTYRYVDRERGLALMRDAIEDYNGEGANEFLELVRADRHEPAIAELFARHDEIRAEMSARIR